MLMLPDVPQANINALMHLLPPHPPAQVKCRKFDLALLRITYWHLCICSIGLVTAIVGCVASPLQVAPPPAPTHHPPPPALTVPTVHGTATVVC
jgi:hypothetical protein